MLKLINEKIKNKNKKQYDTLKTEKEKLESKIKEKEKEFLEQKKIKVNAIKKNDDKEKQEKESTGDKISIKSGKHAKETLNTILTPEQKVNYLLSKDLIEQYKSFCEELVKQEQSYMLKIQEAKKMSKARSGSAGRIRVFVPKNKGKNLKDRTKSSYIVGLRNEGGVANLMSKNNYKFKETKKTNEKKESSNIKKINTNEI